MQNNQEIFADNASPFNTIKLLSIGDNDGCVKKHIIDIVASTSTVQKQFQLISQSTQSVIIVKQDQYRIYDITMSNDTHTLFVVNSNCDITQFQKEDSSLNYYPVRTLKGHTDSITSTSLSNSKMHLLSASRDEATLRVWDLQNGKILACLNQKGQEDEDFYNCIWSCCWNDEDTLFASGDKYGNVVVWSPPLSIYNTSNQFIAKYKFKVEGDSSDISCLTFQKNGLDLFACYSFDYSNVIRLWSINEKELLDSKSTNATLPLIQQSKRKSKKFPGWRKSFKVRGNMLVVVGKKKILYFSADSLQSMAGAVKFEKVHNSDITSLLFSKDGKYVVSGSDDVLVAIFDSKNGKCVKLIKNADSDWNEYIHRIFNLNGWIE